VKHCRIDAKNDQVIKSGGRPLFAGLKAAGDAMKKSVKKFSDVFILFQSGTEICFEIEKLSGRIIRGNKYSLKHRIPD
jgi:hypothetical protein